MMSRSIGECLCSDGPSKGGSVCVHTYRHTVVEDGW